MRRWLTDGFDNPGYWLPPARLIAVLAGCTAFGVHAQATQANPDAAAQPPDKPKVQQAPAENGAPSVPPRLAPIEVTASSPSNSRIDSIVTKIVITHEDIVRYGDTALSDVLKRLPGVTVEDIPGQSVQIRLRGLGEGYTQILVDGEPVPPGFSIESLSPELIERIEVLRAPTADTSMQAIAGTINIVLRKAVQRPQGMVRSTAQRQGSRGSFSADGQLSDARGSLSYTLPVAIGHSESSGTSVDEQTSTRADGTAKDVWLTEGSRVTRTDRITLTPRLRWALANQDTLSADVFLQHVRYASTSREHTQVLLGAPPALVTDTSPVVVETTAARSGATWQTRWPGGARLETRASVSYTHRRSDVGLTGSDSNEAFALDRNVLSQATESGAIASGKYTSPLAEDHTMSLGFQGEWGRRSEHRRQNEITAALQARTTVDDYRVLIRRFALYAQDEWEPTARVAVYAGVRVETLDTVSGGTAFTDAHNRATVPSPVLQALWKLPGTEHDQLRFSASRTFKSPTAVELTPRRYLSINNTVATPDFQGNPNLRPEVAWGIDAAYERHWKDEGFIGVSAFARRVEDVILNQLDFDGANWFLTPKNSGRAHVKGVELDAKANLKTFIAGGPDVRVHGNLARNWSTVEDVPGPSNRLSRQIPLSANFGLDYAVKRLPVTFGTNFTFRGGGEVRLSRDRIARQPVRRLVDVYALWHVDRRTQVRLALSNVLRQDYTSGFVHFDDNGSTRLDSTVPTQRVARVALELSF